MQHPFHAVDVISVADHDHRIEPHAADDLGCQGDRLHGGLAFGLDYDGFRGHAMAHQVSAAHAAFGEHRLSAGAAGGHDAGSQLAPVQVQGVVQAGSQHRRGPAMILRGAKHQDDVSRSRLVHGRLPFDAVGQAKDADRQDGQRHQRRQPYGPCHALHLR